jgi:protein-disulfide isomerase-like protein with CxxC motif
MATPPPVSDDAPSGGPNSGKRKPESIRIAERDVRLAEEALKDARELKSETAIAAAQERLKEARAALRRIQNADPGEDRQEARRDFMEDYFNRLGPEAASLAKNDPELRTLFDEAIRKGWDEGTFLSELKKTDWWKDPKKGVSWRNAFELEFNNPPGVWNEALKTAKEKIADLANELYNIQIPDDVLNQIARRYYYQGWNNNERGLKVWLAGQFDQQQAGDTELTPGGALLDTERTLSDAAREYGLTRDADWAKRTAQQILNPNSNYDENDAWNELIAEAESKYPVFAGKLSKDRSVRDLASGYIGELAQMLELRDPSSVDLNDPLLRRAFTDIDQTTKEPRLMPLWEFSQAIKKDERWQYTNNALNTYSSIGSDLARMMGFVG